MENSLTHHDITKRKIDDKVQRTELNGRLIFNAQQEISKLDMKIKINFLVIPNTHNFQMQTNQILIEIRLDSCLCWFVPILPSESSAEKERTWIAINNTISCTCVFASSLIYCRRFAETSKLKLKMLFLPQKLPAAIDFPWVEEVERQTYEIKSNYAIIYRSFLHVIDIGGEHIERQFISLYLLCCPNTFFSPTNMTLHKMRSIRCNKL